MESTPSSTYFLHIRSKDGTQLTEERNTNFTVNLVSPIVATTDEQIIVNVISCEIPHSFYAVSSDLANDTIIYDGSSTLTLARQNYDPPELIRKLNADVSFPFTATYNRYTNGITFTNNDGVSHTLNWTTSGASKMLGFLLEDQVVAAGASTTSHGMLDLATVHSLFLKSSLGQGNVLSTRAGNSSTLQKISVDVDPYGVIYLSAADRLTHSVIQGGIIDHITFRITDQNDRMIDLNHVNYEFSLRFQIIKKAQLTSPSLLLPQPSLLLPQPSLTQPFLTQPSLLLPQPSLTQPITDLASETLLDLLLE